MRHCWTACLAFSAALLTISSALAQSQHTSGACSPIVQDTDGNVQINVNCPSTLLPKQLEELKAAVVKQAQAEL